MDKQLRNFQIVLDYIQSFKDWSSRDKSVEHHLVTDRERGHIQLFNTFFNEDNRFRFHVIFHFIIKADGKVWVLVNNTEIEVGIELMKRGISNQEIVVGFIPPKYRKYSEYADA